MTRGRKARRSSGFSLLEAMVAAGILGIGLAALTNSHLASIKGIDSSSEYVTARALAVQIAEDIALMQSRSPALLTPPGCINVFADVNTLPGCRAPEGNAFLAPVGVCSRWFDEEASQAAGAGALDGYLFQQGALIDGGEPFRVDLFVQNHPDPNVDPDRAQVAVVSVCWRDPLSPGRVLELREVRMLNRMF